MNISFVTDCIGYGGAEKMLLFIAKGLYNKGHKVAIINLNNQKGYKLNHVDYSGIDVYELNTNYKNTFVSNYEYLAFTIKSAKQHKSEVIIGFKELANFCAATVGKILRIPSIISERGDPFTSFKNISLIRKIKLKIINSASGAVFQTKDAGAFYSKKLESKSTIIPNPIWKNKDIKSIDYYNLPKEIIYMGRLDNRQKRLDVLLESFRIFNKTHAEYILKIYGSGPDKTFIENKIKEYNIQDKVNMMGASMSPLQDLSNSGIFVITSDYEGISNSLLEAMAVGLPVVSTDHSPGGARFLIKDHENGIIVPLGNSELISKALCEFADNPELAKYCGNNAMYVLDEFSPNVIVDKWEQYVLFISKKVFKN